nr:hypothetical protein B0A51_06640 [Rachicladosporium sp. CCFEE 5018]
MATVMDGTEESTGKKAKQSSLSECRYEGGSDDTQNLDNAPTARHLGDAINAPSGADNTVDEQIVTHFPGLEGIDLLFQPSDTAPQNDMDLPEFHTELTQTNDLFDFSHLWTPFPDAQSFFDDTELFDPRFFALDSTERSELSSPTLRLTTSMQGYFDAKSRPSSPSRDRGAKMWYSKPAGLASHSPDVLKIFIGLFRRHIPQTFAIFAEDADRLIKHHSSYILAMGAVGGLYSIVPGSGDFAQAMHNDARRLSLAELNEGNAVSICSNVALERVKTSILLGIYGLSSGNKRSFEFVEAFQGDLTNAIEVYSMVCKADSDYDEDVIVAQLLAAMYIFDCYRVVIMMRPPSLMWHRMSRVSQRAANFGELGRLKDAVRQLTDGVFRTPADTTHGIASLAAMAPLLWSAVPRHTQHAAAETPLSAARLPRSVLVDAALEKWYQLQVTPSTDVTALVLYHVMQIVLHTDLTTLQAFIYADADSSRRIDRQEIASKALHLWMKSRDYDTAQWHAGKIMELAEFDEFAKDFGLVDGGSSSETEHFYRGYGIDPFVYIGRQAPGDVKRFIGAGFVAETAADFDRGTKVVGAELVDVSKYPGGGQAVSLKDPNGYSVVIHWDQQLRRTPDHGISALEGRPPVNGALDKRRRGEYTRMKEGPSLVHKLGHMGYTTDNWDATSAWYQQQFNFVPTDMLHAPGNTALDVAVFFRLDCGKTYVDHHNFLLARGDRPGTSVHHSSFEVEDIDTQFMGHQWLEKKGHEPVWGIGRHVHGSQVFDYWYDPSHFIIEHFADGDVVNEDTEILRAEAGHMAVWGPPVPAIWGGKVKTEDPRPVNGVTG